MFNILTEVPGTAQSVFDFSTIDTSVVLPTVISIMGAVVAVKLTPMLIKKGYNMILSAIKRA